MRKQIIIAGLALITIGIFYNWNSSQPDISESNIAIPGYFDDLQRQRIMMRGGEIAPQKMLAARKRFRQKTEKLLAANNQKDGGIRGWSTIGPCNIGGRVRAIALQPDGNGEEIIYAGAAGGGLWRSTDGGKTYVVNNDIDLSLAVTSIAVDPVDPDLIYVSTGEGFTGAAGLPGAGIFKSEDGGITFDLLSSTQNDEFYWVNKVVVDPHNHARVYAVVLDLSKNGVTQAASPSILKESDDFGDTWKDIYTSPTALTDIEIHPTDTKVRMISGHGTVLKLEGESWVEKVTGVSPGLLAYPGRVEIALSSDPQIMYALQNSQNANGLSIVYGSEDGGATWEEKGSSNGIFSSAFNGDYNNTIFVDPLDVDVIYLGGVDMWKSVDKGANFTKISEWTVHNFYTNNGETEGIQLHADQHIIVPSLNYSSGNKKVYIGNDGGVQKADDISVASTNFSNSGWDNLTGNMCTVQFYGGAVSENGKFAGAAQDNGILIKDNNNYGVMNDWTHPQTGDGAKVYYRSEDTIYATVNFNGLFRSTDGGDTFTSIFQLITVDQSLLIGPSAYNHNTPSKIYLGGRAIWEYDDNTGTQTQLKQALVNNRFIASLHVDDDLMVVGYDNGGLEYSRNGGMSWSGDITPVTGVGVPNRFITDIHHVFSSKTTDTFIITFGGYRTDNVWKLTLVGSTINFTQLSLGFDMQVNTATTHPQNSNWLYLGTDVGIMASEDLGETWSVTPLTPNDDPIYNNESPFYTEVQELFWDNVEAQGVYHLCAATYGRGIIRSEAVLHESCADLTHTGAEYGTRARPYRTFQNALDVAEDKGTPVIFLEGGDYDEYSENKVLDRRVLIKSEAGTSAIIK